MIVRHAGRLPMRVLGLPGPGESGLPWVVGSVTRAAGLPGIPYPLASLGGWGITPGAPPLLISTRLPTMVTPDGSILMNPPEDLIVNSMPDSMTIFIPLLT